MAVAIPAALQGAPGVRGSAICTHPPATPSSVGRRLRFDSVTARIQ
jgi:hypothetical protein